MNLKEAKIITLLSDFGVRDPYVAEMKAVILGGCPGAQIVDVSHNVAKFDIRMGAYMLASCAPYFPKGTIHVAVVDPGVGTKRRPIVAKCKASYFVGPDNGLLMLAALRQGFQHVHVIENPHCIAPNLSRTFHGRDIFAKAAVQLTKGWAISEIGREIDDYTVLAFSKPKSRGGSVMGEILHIDDFGNIVTNISQEVLRKVAFHDSKVVEIKLGRHKQALKLCSAYGEVSKGSALAIVGSHGFLEVSVNQGNAAERFQVRSGNSISIIDPKLTTPRFT